MSKEKTTAAIEEGTGDGKRRDTETETETESECVSEWVSERERENTVKFSLTHRIIILASKHIQCSMLSLHVY